MVAVYIVKPSSPFHFSAGTIEICLLGEIGTVEFRFCRRTAGFETHVAFSRSLTMVLAGF